jgi:hypothetical protein
MSLRWVRLLHLQESPIDGTRLEIRDVCVHGESWGLTADRTIKSVVTSPTA